MKTEKFKRVLAAMFAAVCVIFCCCTDDRVVQSLKENEKAIPVEFTPEESHYMLTEQKGNSVNPQEAMERLLDCSRMAMTRGESDLKEVGVIYKEEIGNIANDTIFPDTLAYLFESKSQRKQFVVSADNRINESLLAEYERVGIEEDTTQTGLIIRDIIRKGIANQICNEIYIYEKQKDSILTGIQQKLALVSQHDSATVTRFTRRPSRPEGDPPAYQVIEEVVANWHEVAFRDEMIPVYWGQGAPYNWHIQNLANCPYWSNIDTGCGSIAVAQLMAYWKNPLYVDNQLVDWDSLTMSSKISWSDSIRGNKVAALMKAICLGCNTSFGCDESSTDLELMLSYLESIGFNVGSIQPYSSSDIYQSLLNSRPVLITGLNCYGIGHGWNIDGYQRIEKTIRKKTYVYDEFLEGFRLISTTYQTNRSTLFHYNWGWNGYYNGWFDQDCFDRTTGILHPTRSANEDSFEYDVEIVANICPISN